MPYPASSVPVGVLPVLCVLGFVTCLPAQRLKWEVPERGAHVYTRTRDVEDFIQVKSQSGVTWVIEGADGDAHEWRYLDCDEQGLPTGFEQPDFDDSGWRLGRGQFGGNIGSDPSNRTPWRNSQMCLRTTVDLGSRKPKALWFSVVHDDGLVVWLNGKQVIAEPVVQVRGNHFLTGGDLDAWRPGENTIAVRCNDIGGGRRVDVAVANVLRLPTGVTSTDELVTLQRGDRQTTARLRSELFSGYRAPPLLLAGDLNEEGSALAKGPEELRELGVWLAMDLNYGFSGDRIDAVVPRVFRVGDLKLVGTVSATDADGWQTMTATVRSTREPGLGGDLKSYVKTHVTPLIAERFDGQLVVERRLRWAHSRAYVADLRSSLTGRLFLGARGNKHTATVRHQETWRHDSVRDNQDARFRAMVGNSLERGTQYLRQQLMDRNHVHTNTAGDNEERSYNTGRLALGLLALLKGGVPRDDAVVLDCLRELRGRTMVDTYSLGNALMALEAYYAPPGEDIEFKAGRLTKPAPRKPSAADKALMEKWVSQLLTNVDENVDRKKQLRFNYAGGAGWDNSVSQYGFLGLHSARLCGIELPDNVWEAGAKHFCEQQVRNGLRTELRLIDFATRSKIASNPRTRLPRPQQVQANGWSYRDGREENGWAPTWGSMTCAGLAGLAVCESGMRAKKGSRRSPAMRAATKAREAGFAWLARNISTRVHPGAMLRHTMHLHYYLYSLERAALLSGIAIISDRDWYFEGAMTLVLSQSDDGSWQSDHSHTLPISTTAMAVLFLKQSTMPAITGK